MTKVQIERARGFAVSGFKQAKSDGVPSGQLPRSGFDAAAIHLATAARARGIKRRFAVRRAVRQLVETAANASPTQRTRCAAAINALIF